MQTNTEKLYVPSVDDHFIKWGNYDLIENIINSKEFFPVYISGESGGGKTSNVEQACANLGREYIRVNFSSEIEESDLIGQWKLVDGSQVFEKGPVLVAMERGAVLLCDEIEACRAQTLFCMQSVLEGKHVFIKPLNTYVTPTRGFTVFATGNTKGRGDENGRYAGLNIMNAAFLDRFAGMMTQPYPPQDVEQKILQGYYVTNVLKYKNNTELTPKEHTQANTYISNLIKWANQNRETFAIGQMEECITTRTLIHIIKSFALLKDEVNAIKFACERYEAANRDALVELYNSMIEVKEEAEEEPEEEIDDDYVTITRD